MIWRLLSALRRLVRIYTSPSEFSSQWHRDQDRVSWQSGYEFPRWQGEKVDQETWKAGR